MLNYLRASMMLAGIVWAAVHGNLGQVMEGTLQSAKEAVALSITMLGIMSFWTGILKIGERAGLIRRLSEKMGPLMKFLFPRLEPGSPAVKYMSANMIANALGLGWAATPAGLKAMEELKVLNGGKDTASNEMCVFLIINISSLQLIPMNMIAYRSQYGSIDPGAIAAPALLATCISTAAGVIFCKWMERRER